MIKCKRSLQIQKKNFQHLLNFCKATDNSEAICYRFPSQTTFPPIIVLSTCRLRNSSAVSRLGSAFKITRSAKFPRCDGTFSRFFKETGPGRNTLARTGIFHRSSKEAIDSMRQYVKKAIGADPNYDITESQAVLLIILIAGIFAPLIYFSFPIAVGVQTYLHEYAAYCQSKRLGFAMMRAQSRC